MTAPVRQNVTIKVEEDYNSDSDDLDAAPSQRRSQSQVPSQSTSIVARPSSKPPSTSQSQSRMPPPSAPLSNSRPTNTNSKASATKPNPEREPASKPRKSRRGQAVSQLGTLFAGFDEPLPSSGNGPSGKNIPRQDQQRVKNERFSSPPLDPSPRKSSVKERASTSASIVEQNHDQDAARHRNRKRATKTEIVTAKEAGVKLEEIPLFDL